MGYHMKDIENTTSKIYVLYYINIIILTQFIHTNVTYSYIRSATWLKLFKRVAMGTRFEAYKLIFEELFG